MGQTLRDQKNDYPRPKEERYLEFRALLDEALEAGRRAVLEKPPGRPPRRGTVRVRLMDGRSSFARFIRQEQPDGWQHGKKRSGTFFPVHFADYDKALVYAEAMHAVLSGGEVDVTVEARDIPDQENP